MTQRTEYLPQEKLNNIYQLDLVHTCVGGDLSASTIYTASSAEVIVVCFDVY